MEDVFRMYAMSDGDPDGEPMELDPDQVEDFATRMKKKSKPPAFLPLQTTTR